MLELREVLKVALAHGPASLVIESGRRPRIEREGHQWDLEDFHPVSASEFARLFTTLLPQVGEEREDGQPIRGQLHTREWGALSVEGSLGPTPTLAVYPSARSAPGDVSSPSLVGPGGELGARNNLSAVLGGTSGAQLAWSQLVSPETVVRALQGNPEHVKAQSLRISYSNTDGGGRSSGDNPFDAVLRAMVRHRASDLHLTLGCPVAMRIDGDIRRMGDKLVTEEQLAQWLDPVIPERNKREFIERNDSDFAYEIAGLGRFRVNLFRDRLGVGAVVRMIPADVISFDALGLPDEVRQLCALTKGLVVVTGPTGSGKSTTLAALIDHVNATRTDHIITIEDPIEFVHRQRRCLIHQREVHRHTTSFSAALRAALREDPDIVLIGELRDQETIATAIETAETGHLVFGTLHTNTAISTVDRIIDSFPTEQQSQVRAMLAESLRGVIAQTLLKRVGGGRVAAYEILMCDRATSAMIREGKTQMMVSRMQTHRLAGNRLLNDSLLELVKAGAVEPDEAHRKAVDKTGLVAAFKSNGISYADGAAEVSAA